MSYIEILVLSHLAGHSSHGYELRQRVQATAGVSLHNNSLYPALRRFEEAGAVTKEVEATSQGRPARHVYAITDTGRQLLHDLLAELPAEQGDDDIEFLTRVGQFEHLTTQERHRLIGARQDTAQRRLQHLQEVLSRSQQRPWGLVVVRELQRRTVEELVWLEQLHGAADDPSQVGLSAS